MSPGSQPLPSRASEPPEAPGEEEDEETEGTDEGSEEARSGAEDGEVTPEPAAVATSSAQRPPAPTFKFSTFILIFLFFLGMYMLIDAQARNQIAGLFGDVLAPAIGFGGHYLMLTMFLAALVEMLVTAVVYNITTDWVLMAEVQQHAAAIRPHQMKAIRSGKKDRMEALKPHLDSLQRRQSRVTINQLKGMAVTYFLLIAIYTWVGLFIAAQQPHTTVIFAGATINLLSNMGPIPAPYWFFIFSLYTLPLSLILRRYFKHYTLSRRQSRQGTLPDASAEGAP